MCRRLHEDGLLNENLLPRKRNLDSYIDELDCSDSKRPKIGTKRSKSYYEIQTPIELTLMSGSKFNPLYKIDMKLVQESSYTKIVKQYSIFDPQDSSRKLGLIIGSPLPKGSTHPFDLFTYSGQVEIQLKHVGDLKWPLEKDLFDLLQTFHVRAFEDVIGFNQDIVAHCKDKNDELLVVPLNSKDEIDIDFLEQWNLKDKNRNLDLKKKFHFNKEDYKDAVILPQHRTGMEHFIVEEIVQDRSPKSFMNETPTSQTFANFYEKQYGCPIVDSHQPLLRYRFSVFTLKYLLQQHFYYNCNYYLYI